MQGLCKEKGVWDLHFGRRGYEVGIQEWNGDGSIEKRAKTANRNN